MKKLITAILVAVILAVTIQLLIDNYANPNISVFIELLDYKKKWFSELRKNNKDIHVIVGGSEIATSVDPELMFNMHGIAVVNAGLHAGFGSRCNFVVAEQFIIPHAHVVCSSYPDVSETYDGCKFIFKDRGFASFSSGIVKFNSQNLSDFFCGRSLSNVYFLKSKLENVQPWYNVSSRAIKRESGLLEILDYSFQKLADCDNREQKVIRDDWDKFLMFCKEAEMYCQSKKATFSVILPIVYNDDTERVNSAKFALFLVKNGINVLKDSRLGISSSLADFADTPNHASKQGRESNARHWGAMLKNKEYWNASELEYYIKSKYSTNSLHERDASN